MKTNLNRPLTYFILGLPRSGTTIVASFFNSLDDGFCLGEPHWYAESGERNKEAVGQGCCGKVRELWDIFSVETPYSILNCFIRPALDVGDYRLGGYKETWRGDALGHRLLADHLPLVDFFVLVFRNPDEIWRSQMRRGWPGDEWTKERAKTGNAFLTGLSYHPKSVSILLDDFTVDPLACVNRQLGGRFEVEGPVALKPTGWVFGDPRANKSEVIDAG